MDNIIKSQAQGSNLLGHQSDIARQHSRQSQSESAESGAARCVLCLTRAPSAVLLPCAHLVLCHICAPALILRSCTAQASLPEAAVEAEAEPTKPTWQETVRRASASLERSPELKRRLLGLMPSSEEAVDDETCDSEPREGLGRVIRQASASHPQHRHRSSDQHQQQGQIAPADLATRFQSMQVNHQTILTSKGDAQAQCVVCRAGVVGWLRVYGA